MKVRRGNDKKITVMAERQGQPLDFATLQVMSVVLVNGPEVYNPYWSIKTPGIELELNGRKLLKLGDWFVVIRFRTVDSGFQDGFFDEQYKAKAFELVPTDTVLQVDEAAIQLSLTPAYKGDMGGVSILNFEVTDDMRLMMELETNSTLDFELNNEGRLILKL